MGKRRGERSGNPGTHPTSRTVYWHGGAPGLRVGALLVPNASSVHRSAYRDADVEYDITKVYVTSDRQLARAFAASYRGPTDAGAGTLYRVGPELPLEPDPDYPFEPPVSFTCPKAKVLRVAESRVRMSDIELTKATAPYAFWPDGSPMYDGDGYLTLDAATANNGVTVEMLRSLGPWRHYTDAQRDLARMSVARHLDAGASG